MLRELYSTFMSAIDEGNKRSIPNRSMPAAPHPTPGALVLGNAFNMRHPLTGGGMTTVLSDIVMLRDLLRNLRNLNNAYIFVQDASSITFPIIKAKGVRQMFFPTTVLACYRAPPMH
ncbi:unnamed protein product [Ilex paraguariensis]|uniref:Squalene monooxygenase n=1 Tax=Ilex paraguariensis TaxID=185542 RepID=A0ABC8U0I7_9AQUA